MQWGQAARAAWLEGLVRRPSAGHWNKWCDEHVAERHDLPPAMGNELPALEAASAG